MGRLSKTPEAEAFARCLGRTIRSARKARGVKAASMAYDVGITAQAVSRIEKGHHVVTIGTLMLICAVLNVPMWMLIKLAQETETRNNVFVQSAAKIAQEYAE